MIKDKNVAKETKTAVAEEKDRRKRIEERQAQYNKMFSLTEEPDKPITKLVLDFDPDSKDVLVEVDKKIVSKLKPHQARGVKFMWDACFESIAQIEEDKVCCVVILRLEKLKTKSTNKGVQFLSPSIRFYIKKFIDS